MKYVLENLEHTAMRNILSYHEDFPIPGITFVDISPLLDNMAALKQFISKLAKHIKHEGLGIKKIYGIESRGFIFGSLLAYEMDLPFGLIRKINKLPGEKLGFLASNEYSEKEIEFEIIKEKFDSKNSPVLIVDDILATGTTLLAAYHFFTKTQSVPAYALAAIDIGIVSNENDLFKDIICGALVPVSDL